MANKTLIEKLRQIPPKIFANLGLFYGAHQAIQALDVIQSQPDMIEGMAYLTTGAALVGLNRHVISPVVEKIDKKLTGTKKRVGYNLASTASAACLVALLASQCATPPKRVQEPEPFSYNDKYSPTPRLNQSVFDVNGEHDANIPEEKTKIAKAFNSWDLKQGDLCEKTQAEQVMMSNNGDIYIRANCNEKRVVEQEPEVESTPIYCDLSTIRDFSGQKQYKPFSKEAKELFRQAAKCAKVPKEWAYLDSLHNLLKSESIGRVGVPNYTILLTSTGKEAQYNPESWDQIHLILNEGYDALVEQLFENRSVIYTNHSKKKYSSASGLGQLILRNVDRHYPTGKDGIGNPLAEATGMLSYIKARHGNPNTAWRRYNKDHEGY
jgi:hypothetical protein